MFILLKSRMEDWFIMKALIIIGHMKWENRSDKSHTVSAVSNISSVGGVPRAVLSERRHLAA